ncbi:MAG TPA: SDR family oxidoreductase [Trebonia sp.]|jgi:NAD(P)-dependent dehydrogenase (short-subunit alcohol dehydrogenase family)|nr:SDR family oxidoreductase [Trebonia sp.]
MHLDSISVLVTGGSSGLGLATARRLLAAGARVGIADLNPPADEDLDSLGAGAVYAKTDVTDEVAVTGALDAVEAANGRLRAVVHCAGRGGDRVRILDKDGTPGSLETFTEVIRVNLAGTYNVLRLGAARIARSEPVDGERGAIVLTASVAAFDGQIGQTSYTAAKAAVHGITLVAARDLAGRQIRVNTIAPGVFDTPMLSRLRPDIRAALEQRVPHPSRLGAPDDYARMVVSLLENPYVNGETIRLDGAIRMPPR